MDSNLTNDRTLTEVLLELAESRERHLGVALPGIVVSYSSGTQTASIQPAVNRLVPELDAPDEDVSETLPIIQNVPVMWPRGRNFSVAGTLAAGDPVLLVCLDRDMSGWRSSGQLSDPLDVRTHDWASAVAIPGLVPAVPAFQPPPSDAAALASVLDTLGRTIGQLHITPGPVTNLGTLVTAVNAILLAFNTAWPSPSSSVGSSILKLGS